MTVESGRGANGQGAVSDPIILAIEPTASATRLALFRGDRPVAAHTARHVGAMPEGRERPADQVGWRTWAARSFLDEAGVAPRGLAAVAAAGGLLKPVEGGTYRVDAAMLRDCQRSERGYHPANLGALVASEIASEHGCPAFVVDPLSVDELEPVAKLGADDVALRTCGNALAMRGVARRHAQAVERDLEQLKLVVARLGDDSCLSALRDGRLVDVVVPDEGGLVSRLGVRDVAEAELRAERGECKAMIVVDALAYQIAKSVGALAAGLDGEVDAVLLTGNRTDATALVNGICRRVEWIAPVFVYPGDDHMLALAQGAWRVLTGAEHAKSYGV